MNVEIKIKGVIKDQDKKKIEDLTGKIKEIMESFNIETNFRECSGGE